MTTKFQSEINSHIIISILILFLSGVYIGVAFKHNDFISSMISIALSLISLSYFIISKNKIKQKWSELT